jgi:alkyldihydroxyacetonephosphate synthase
MDRLLDLDVTNLTATFEAGVRGSELERVLATRGFTSGHEPDSMEISTLGGWIATNASGMKKNRYGNIEDIVENVTMVTPAGPIRCARGFARTSMGIQPMGIVLGSEGNLGIVTRATLRIHPLPEKQVFESYLFHTSRDGLDFVYRIAHCGSVPASVRLMDNLQFRFGQALRGRHLGLKRIVSRLQRYLVTRVLAFDPSRMVVATVVLEGTAAEISHQQRLLKAAARATGGFGAGASNGRQGYMLTYAIAYIRDFLATLHILGETFETTAPWDRVEAVTGAVSARLVELCQAHRVPGKPFLSWRITQLYHTGVCIYFTLGLYLKGVDNPARVLAAIERGLRVAILEAGGSISHHHGVGKIRREFISTQMSPAAARAIRALKSACDPTNVFGIGNNLFGAGETDAPHDP